MEAIFTTLVYAIPDFLVINPKQKITTYCPPGPYQAMLRKFPITHISLAIDAKNHQKKSDNELKILLLRSEQ